MPLAALRPFTRTATPALTSASIRIPARSRRVLTALPVTTATAIACALVNVAGWRGQDFPAALLRISVFRQGGWFWNPQWFGGHPTLGYSVLFPVLGALTSAAILGLLATTGAVAGFEVFVRDRPRAMLATIVFAFGMISNFVVGRIPFALGCALGMACIATLGSYRIVAACLAVLASLSSPIAALFLVIVLTGWIAAKRGYAVGRSLSSRPLGPALVLSVFLGTGATFRFRSRHSSGASRSARSWHPSSTPRRFG